jgi:GTP-binding protein
MQIRQATFIMSNTDYTKCPEARLPEFAFIGRSNVGKSSLINMLCERRKLAKTSVRPGKTQLINHFLINEEWYLVDLPGYGYAKVSQKDRAQWQFMINSYLLNRINLMATFILIDSRIPPQKIDEEMIASFGENALPFALVFTKTDKLKPAQLAANLETYKTSLLENWEELPPFFISSSETGLGRDEILDFIDESRKVFNADSLKKKED